MSGDLLDVERLARWMDSAGLPGSGEKPAVRAIAGGASNDIFELRRGGVPVKLPVMPIESPAIPVGATRHKCDQRRADF